MEPRDLFDGVLLVLVAVVAYLEVFGVGISRSRLDQVVEALLGLGPGPYLVLAGILGVVYVGYVAIYVPAKVGRSG